MKTVRVDFEGQVYIGKLGADGTISLAEDGRVVSPAEVTFLPPINRLGKIICVGLNYPPPEAGPDWTPPPYPILFQKPASALTGHGSAIVLPRISEQVLYEGELAVVIGERGRNLAEGQALGVIAGYTIANDVGAADIEARSSQWASGKMFDTFCPLGPALVFVEEIADPGNLMIRTWLNETLVQDGSTAEMIFSVPFLVSYISQLTTLEPGDLILTGSPKRVGERPDPRTPLRDGDEVRIEIDGLGALLNPVRMEMAA